MRGEETREEDERGDQRRWGDLEERRGKGVGG